MRLCANCPTLVVLSRKTCHYCKLFYPELEKLVAADGEAEGRLHVVHLEKGEHPEAGSAFGIQGFPTILIYAPTFNKFVEYRGERTADAITTAATAQMSSLTFPIWENHPPVVA